MINEVNLDKPLLLLFGQKSKSLLFFIYS